MDTLVKTQSLSKFPKEPNISEMTMSVWQPHWLGITMKQATACLQNLGSWLNNTPII